MANGAIRSTRRFPISGGARPLVIIENPASEADPGRGIQGSPGSISAKRRFPYQAIFGPVFGALAAPVIPQNIDKWKPQYPNAIDRREIHASQIARYFEWDTTTPFFGDVSWAEQTSIPIRPEPFNPGRYPYTRHNPPFQVPLTPALWEAEYPNIIPRRPTFIPALAPSRFYVDTDIVKVVPTVSSWGPNTPSFIYSKSPINHLASFQAFELPSNLTLAGDASVFKNYPDFIIRHHTAPERWPWEFQSITPELRVDLEVTSWLPNVPDFINSRPPTYFLGPSSWWHTITGPDVIAPSGTNQFRDTRRR